MAGGAAMLIDQVKSYLAIRRATGFELKSTEQRLLSYAGFATERGELYVRAKTAIQWAQQPASSDHPYRRLNPIVLFARYLRAEDPRHEIPSLNHFPYKVQRRIPYILTTQETALLIREAGRIGPAGSIRPHAYAALLALLSATGMRISEALSLQLDDLLQDGLLIRMTKFRKSRLIPLHATAQVGLEKYLALRARIPTEDRHLFISTTGRKLSNSRVHQVFPEIVKAAGFSPRRGKKPRFHDFRHTFCVRALQACPGNRDQVAQNMLAVSTYMGHSKVASTYWYLEAVPELLENIARACDDCLKGTPQ